MRKILLLIILFLQVSYVTKATIYTVNTNSDVSSGAGTTGSLRWCIGQANGGAGKDTINFALTGGGPYTLTVGSNYPVITNPLYINGYSQTGSVQAALGTGSRVLQIILLGPGNSTVYGLQFTASNSTVCGLVIQNFYQGIYINGGSNDWIWGCYIGTSVNGLATSAATQCYNDGIVLGNSAKNNFIGTNGDGTNDANEGNLIAGNGDSGIQYAGECISINKAGNLSNDCSGNRISGNYLGTNETGTAALYFNNTAGTQRGSGIQINFSTANIIGTNADGISDALERNVISGNSDEGIVLVNSSSNLIKGNYIGVDKTGNVGLPNYIDGGTNLSMGQIVIKSSSTNNVIGTDGDGVRDNIEGNVIGGLTLAGVALSYSDGIDITTSSTGNRVCGNYIGIGANGTTAVPILTSGIVVIDYAVNVNANNNIIGTNGDGVSDALEANYIGNTGAAIVLDNASGCTVAGNYCGLGTNLTTSEALGYAGVYIIHALSNRIGSSASNSLEKNYICNSSKYGIWVDGSATARNDLNNIRYNWIGIRPDNVSAPNAQYGIYVYNQSNADTIQYNTITNNGTAVAIGTYSGIQIGGSALNQQSSGNVIYNNTIYKNIGPGINIVNTSSLTNKISQNSIYNNGNGSDATGKLKLGIDLGADGVTANDNLDPDTGPNGLTNFPIITGATTNTSCVATLSGTYNGLATTQYMVEVFSSPVCNGDTAGVDYFSNATNNFGEGKTYVGTSGSFITNASGNGAWTLAITLSTYAGQYLTAVAIQTNGAAINSTSEFSKCYSLSADFGDAPDSYGTLIASCGPEHLNVSSTLKIGGVPLTKSDGTPGINADGDTDEDGLTYPLPALNTKSTTYSLSNIPVTNTTGSTATLYGWIDFNVNGVFESTEFTSASVANGATTATLTWNLASLTCNSTLVAGISYLRLRLTTDALVDNAGTPAVDERSKGVASNGEVEDYRITILPVDFGDCPNTYPVAMAAVQYDTTSGKVWAGVTKPGVECTQKYSVDAYGDGAEEDGLTTATGTLGQTYTWVIKLNSNLSPKTVYYGLWIDWDANQNFISGMDAFYSGSIVTNGPTTTSISVLMPLGSSNNAFMRLVASSSAVTSGMYNATFTNGEIEDYSLLRILASRNIVLSGSSHSNGNTLFWTTNALPGDKYVVEKSSDAISWNTMDTVTVGNTGSLFNYTELHSSAHNFYRVQIIAEGTKSSYSNTILIDREKNPVSFAIFPNPVRETLHVQGVGNSKKLVITDLTGRVELEKRSNDLHTLIDVSRLSVGPHFITMIGEDGHSQVIKFIKVP